MLKRLAAHQVHKPCLMAHGSDIRKSCKMVVDVVESSNSVVADLGKGNVTVTFVEYSHTQMKIARIICILDFLSKENQEDCYFI